MLIKDGTKRKSAAALMIMPFVAGKQHQNLMSLLKAATKPAESYENWTAPPRPPRVDPVTHRAPPPVPAEDGGAPPPRPAARITQSAEALRRVLLRRTIRRDPWQLVTRQHLMAW